MLHKLTHRQPYATPHHDRVQAGARQNGHRKKGHRKKGHGKKGTGKMGTGKKGTSEKLGKKGTKRKKNFICKLLLLLFNEHLNYSRCIFCGCLLFKLLEIWL